MKKIAKTTSKAKDAARKNLQVVDSNPASAHSYFVLLHYPKEFRRSLLESSRNTIYSLQRYHRIKLLRDEKKREIALLKSQMRELQFLFGKLLEQLPADVLPPKVPQKVVAPALSAPTKHPMNKQIPAGQKTLPLELPKKKPMTELEALGEHLSKIEDRLRLL